MYSVALPLKGNVSELGDSRKMAATQFSQLERKFGKDGNLKTMYTEYMEEMLIRGYMRKCESNITERNYYLPRRPEFKKSVTMKVRPVFNASVKTSSGKSSSDIFDRWSTFTRGIIQHSR